MIIDYVKYNKMRNIVYIAACLLGTEMAQAGETEVVAGPPAISEEGVKKGKLERMKDRFNQAKDASKNTGLRKKAGEAATQVKSGTGSAKTDMGETASPAVPVKSKEMLEKLTVKICTRSASHYRSESEYLKKQAQQLTAIAQKLTNRSREFDQAANELAKDCSQGEKMEEEMK
jgi:hypothetical protein